MSIDSLHVDLADRDDVRAKLPQAKAILERKEDVVREAEKDADAWRKRVALLSDLAGITPEENVTDERFVPDSASGPVELVVRVVNEANAPIRSRDVAAILRNGGYDIDKDSVSNALYYASLRADPPRIKKMQQRGFYAPLHHPETDYALAAELGLPVPERIPDPEEGDD